MHSRRTRTTCQVLAILVVLVGFSVIGNAIKSADDKSSATAQIKRVLTTQADAWNNGNIDAFMEHYWKSEKLTFSSGGTTTRGWTTTKQNYKKRYPTRERMGKLTFAKLEFFPLGDSAMLVLGNWNLERDPKPIGGNFSLVFRRIDKRWLIIHDHTSLLASKTD